MYNILLLIMYSVALVNSDDAAFTSYVNVEKLYTMEDELISIADAVLMQEVAMHDREDVHDLDEIRSVMETSLEIHTHIEESSDSLSSYLIHPINIYHLVKRLVRDWTEVADALGESKTCMITMSSKIQNIEENMPTEDLLKDVCRNVLAFQTIHNISVADVMSGTIAEKTSLKPLSLNDAFLLARVAYDSREFNSSADWLTYVLSNYDKGITTFELTAAYNLQSSTYFMLGRPMDALDMLDNILVIDPDNVSAKRNRKFMQTTVEDGRTTRSRSKPTKGKLIQELCSGKYKMTTEQESQHVCAYYKHRDDGMFYKPSIKAEIFNMKPLIVMFHNVTNRTEAKAMYYLAYEQMRDVLYKDMYQYPLGVDSIYVQDQTKWQWLPALKQKLNNIEISSQEPWTSDLIVTTIGMAGHALNLQVDDQRIGTFLAFLSDVENGGEVVFSQTKTKVKPIKGTILFYEKKIKNEASICPVLVDTEWVGIYPLHGVDMQQVCPVQPVIRPKTR